MAHPPLIVVFQIPSRFETPDFLVTASRLW